MALKVKAKEQKIKIGKYADTYRYVMMSELYTSLNQQKVIKEVALRGCPCFLQKTFEKCKGNRKSFRKLKISGGKAFVYRLFDVHLHIFCYQRCEARCGYG